MKITCRTCKTDNAKHWRMIFDKGNKSESCDNCDKLGIVSIPDVYFKGAYFDLNLADSKNPGGRWISSRGEKARIMKEQGVSEAGDRVHGSRNYDRPGANRNKDIWKQ